ncbi:MAG: hypothetical protein EHM60_09975 [Lysobacterales bacterium]|jgi:hypothetical protein|nr:MAG: hypothetical protein EHM60_09975 [Xanthomonadales bacterium]
MSTLPRELVKSHRRELSYIVGGFTTDHLIRLYAAFDGDLAAAIVLGTIGQHYIQQYYEAVARESTAGLDRLVDEGRHLARVRSCNAMSVSAATGIPRETVRRKVRWLVEQDWITVGKRGELALVPGMSRHFEAFDLETIARFHRAATDFHQQVSRRRLASTARR